MCATNNLMKILFVLPLTMEYLNTCRMNWRINMRTVFPYPMNNSVTWR